LIVAINIIDKLLFIYLLFGRPYYQLRLWYTVSSVCLSVTFYIVAKWCVLAKKLSEGVNRKPGTKSWFIWVATIFLLPVSLYGTNWLTSSKPCAYCRIVWSEFKPEEVLATNIDTERCK